jgi:hypothetical protein
MYGQKANSERRQRSVHFFGFKIIAGDRRESEGKGLNSLAK